MAKGYPDFFGQSIFLKYGPFKTEWAEVTVDNVSTADIVSIETKGTIQGGYLFTNDADAGKEDSVILEIDGIEIVKTAFQYLFLYGYDLNIYAPIILVEYDRDSPVFTVLLKDKIPFDTSVVLAYKNVGFNDVTVEAAIYYQEVIA